MKKITKLIVKTTWFNSPSFYFLVVVISAFCLRYYHLVQLFPFTMDEEYQAFLAVNTIKTGHVPLIGVNVAGTGLYLGPFFTWFSALIYYVGHLNPLFTGLVAAFIGTITAGLLYYLIWSTGKNTLAALVVGLAYASNPVLVSFDRKFWNPSLVMLLTILWLLTISKVKQDKRYWILISAVLGAALHVHYSLLILVIPSLVILGKTQKKIIWSKTASLAVLVFGIFISPLLLFELRHGFLQSKALLHFGQNQLSFDIFAKLKVMLGSFGQLGFLGWFSDMFTLFHSNDYPILLLVLGLIVIIASLYIAFTHRKQTIFYAIFLAFVSVLAMVVVYPGPISAYYFLPIWPMLIALGGLLLSQKEVAQWVFGLITILILIWITQSLTLTNHLGFSDKQKVLELVRSFVQNQPYHLEVLGSDSKYEGYRYLAEYLKLRPVSSYMDAYFDWLYVDQADKQTPIFNVVIYDSLDDSIEAKREWQNWQKKYDSWHLVTNIHSLNVLISKPKD
ncbi:glycosyltransferase family 39 protein [Candidatus Beckwithbacteria bacterium]|nr:glycosyltransferase family 39 protein [Candidatus Beckwithbacteria bacterium]